MSTASFSIFTHTTVWVVRYLSRCAWFSGATSYTGCVRFFWGVLDTAHCSGFLSLATYFESNEVCRQFFSTRKIRLFRVNGQVERRLDGAAAGIEVLLCQRFGKCLWSRWGETLSLSVSPTSRITSSKSKGGLEKPIANKHDIEMKFTTQRLLRANPPTFSCIPTGASLHVW